MTKSKEDHIADFIAEEEAATDIKKEIVNAIDSIDESETLLINELQDIILGSKPSRPS